jgi:hypothetical protein
MIASIGSFLDFCYLIRRDSHTESTLREITDALSSFHRLRQVFVDAGIYPDGISLPRQHSLTHYRPLIEAFGSPNGLCSSITESKHIKAVKEPWRRSNKYKALSQMLVTNQRIEKLASASVEFQNRNMLDNDVVSAEIVALQSLTQAFDVDNILSSSNIDFSSRSSTEDLNEQPDYEIHSDAEGVEESQCGDLDSNSDSEGDEDGNVDGSGDSDGNSAETELGPVDGTRLDAHAELARQRGESSIHTDYLLLTFNIVCNIPRSLEGVAAHYHYPQLPELTRRFLYNQLHPNSPHTSETIALSRCPMVYEHVNIFTSAIAIFWAPSDPSGIGGMRQERIRVTPSWRKAAPRYDCMFLSKDPSVSGFRGLHVVRALLFFSFKYNDTLYPCALVQWFLPIGDQPDETCKMWVVEPELDGNGARTLSVIHIDTVLRAAHLIPCYGNDFLPSNFHFTDTLDAFRAYYVNKYVDHSAHAMLS